MAHIFLSYRRSDSPQACRVYDALVQRFGKDAVFMDVAAIPFAVSFTEYIRREIEGSKLLLALIGPDWQTRMHESDDPVRMELETAMAAEVKVLPLLIGTTPMPDGDALPTTLGALTTQNAMTVGSSHDFYSHMQQLLPLIESILGTMTKESVALSDPAVIRQVCDAIMFLLQQRCTQSYSGPGVNWLITNASFFGGGQMGSDTAVTFFLHRVRRLAETLELHFILSFWCRSTAVEQSLAGWTMQELERNPIVPRWAFGGGEEALPWRLTIRTSDEDARQIWKMASDEPLRLSLSYVATVLPAE